MSNAKIRHRRHRRAKRSAHIQPTEYASAPYADPAYQTGRTAAMARGSRVHTILALAALATLGVRF